MGAFFIAYDPLSAKGLAIAKGAMGIDLPEVLSCRGGTTLRPVVRYAF